MGETRKTSDCMLPLVAFTLVSLSWGTNWGINAPTAGICIAVPSARIADITKSNHSISYPIKNSMAKMRVDMAIIESDSIISILRL